MQVVSGVIDSIYTKEVNTKFGSKDVYHAMINGVDINLGFKCAYSEGESVSLNVEQKYGSLQLVPGNGSGQPASPAVSGQASKVPQAAPAPKQQAYTEFPVPKNTKGITIARQNSGGHAARIVGCLIDNGTIKSKDEAIEAFMDVAYSITDFATGHREVNEAAAMQAYDAQDETNAQGGS